MESLKSEKLIIGIIQILSTAEGMLVKIFVELQLMRHRLASKLLEDTILSRTLKHASTFARARAAKMNERSAFAWQLCMNFS